MVIYTVNQKKQTLTLHMTPSQSNMNTSTSGSKSFAGSVNLRTLALRAVVDVKEDAFILRDGDGVNARAVVVAGRNIRRAAGVNARALDANARASADFARFIVRGYYVFGSRKENT